EEEREREVEVEEPERRKGRQHPGDAHSDRDEPKDHGSRLGDLSKAKAQPALEEDHADAERDDRKEELAEDAVGIDGAPGSGKDVRAERPDEESREEEEKDRRQAQAPREPLRADPGEYDPRKRGEDLSLHLPIALVRVLRLFRVLDLSSSSAITPSLFIARSRRRRQRESDASSKARFSEHGIARSAWRSDRGLRAIDEEEREPARRHGEDTGGPDAEERKGGRGKESDHTSSLGGGEESGRAAAGERQVARHIDSRPRRARRGAHSEVTARRSPAQRS